MSRNGNGILFDERRRDRPYRARYTDAYGRRKTRSFPTEAKAKRWLNSGRTEADEIRDALDRGEQPVAKQKRDALLFGKYVDGWLKGKTKLSPSTRSRYGEFASQVKSSWLADVPADDLSRDHIMKFMAELAERYAGNTCLNMLRFLRTMTKDLKAERRLLYWACERVERPKAVARYSRENPNLLSRSQCKQLLHAAATTKRLTGWHPIIALMLSTGMRFCEVAALKWKDIDYDQGLIYVRRSVYRGEVLERTKTGKDRAPAIIPEVQSLLKAHHKACPGLPEAWVFPSRTGEPRGTGSINKPLARLLKEAEVTGKVTGHGLRRTFNELASQNDKTGITTRAITGHSDVGMQEHYREVPATEKRKLQVSAMAGILE